VPQHFLPLRGAKPEGAGLVYAPMLLGAAQVRFADAKSGVDSLEDVTLLAPMAEGPVTIDWDRATKVDLAVADLEPEPEQGAQFLAVPAGAGKAKSYADWSRDFGAWLYRTQKLDVLKSPSTKAVSAPGESERDFRLRMQQAGREQRDQAAERLRHKYAPKIAALQERVRRAEQMKARQQTEARASQVQAAISVGASILGAFLGRKAISQTNIGRATTAIRSAGRVLKESQDVGHAEETIAALQQQLADLDAQFKGEADALAAAIDPLTEKLEPVSVKPSKADIAVKLVALVWAPQWLTADGATRPAWS
jgi:hypothetical protein